ncbi:MAG: protein kinase [Candidatus Sumerlaeia bacterium]|nr:protein kinase [Candidatus Sumerlaeia bacterium]
MDSQNPTVPATQEDLSTLLPASPEATYNRSRTLTAAPDADGSRLAATAPLDDWTAATRVTVSVPAAPGAPMAPEDGPGRADYTMVRVIGAGGMGQVWEAEQRSLNRIVAVKRLSPRLEAARGVSPSDAVHLREEFRREALISARLEHPNIVPVHDRAIDGDGNPLLAMKRVHGRPWSDMLREDFASMPEGEYLRKHLAILQQMTLAVAFAHSKGIVHRDLKPSQVMVGEFGEALLMDWGLAFFTGEDPDDVDWVGRVGVTRQETASNPSGTVAYMAPEQTRHEPDGLGTWTDVYLLGATLYQVLTGTHPHRAANSAIAFERARRGVVEAPSARAPGRRIAPELEAICLRAMAADRKERFESARAFHDAVEAYQSGASQREESRAIAERVSASAGELATYAAFNAALSEAQRARQLWPENPALDPLESRLLLANAEFALGEGDLRLAAVLADRLPTGEPRARVEARILALEEGRAARERQRRALMVASFAFLALLVLAGAGFIWHIEVSRREIELERNRAVTAESEAERQRAEAVSERDRAQASRAESEELVTFMVEDLATRLEAVGRLDVLDSVLDKVGAQMESRRQRTLTAQEREATGRLLERIVDVRMAQGNIPEAEAAAARVLELAMAAVAANPDDAYAYNSLGSAWARVGSLRLAKGEYDVALDALRKFESNAEQALALVPGSDQFRYNLSTANGFVAHALNGLGDRAGAAASYGRMRARLEEVLAKDPEKAEWLRDLAVAYTMEGVLAQAAEDYPRAADSYLAAQGILQRLLGDGPPDTLVLHDMGANWQFRGQVAKATGNLDEAVAHFMESHRIARDLVELEPANVAWRRIYRTATEHLGSAQRAAKQLDQALSTYREAIVFFLGRLAADPSDESSASTAADMHLRAGYVFSDLGDAEREITEYEAGIAILEAIPDRSESASEALAKLHALVEKLRAPPSD